MLHRSLTTRLSRRSSETGFTLLELLIVVIVIGVLAAIALPIFLNQQRAAIDATVKSDVRNTAAQVQGWLAQNRTGTAADTANYKSKQGTVTKSRDGSVVGVQVLTGGTYTVCAFDAAGNNYKTAETAWLFNSATGKFTAQASGTCPGAVDGDGNDVSTTPVAPTFTDDALGTATQETDYADGVKASGNPAPTYSAPTSGANALVAGLSLNPTTGAITGQPTASAGDYEVAVTAKNFAGSVTKKVAIKVLSKDAAPTFAQGASATAPTATRGTQYAGYDASASGYPAPTYTVDSGVLPSGLSLNKDTGAISGTPDSGAVSGTPVIKATNRAGSKTLALTINVQYAPYFQTTSLANAYTDSAFSATVTAFGSPTPTAAVDKTTLPAGITATVSGASIAFSGTPTQSGTFNVKVSATNSVGSSGTQTLTWLVASSTVYSENFEGYDYNAQYTNYTPSGFSIGGTCLYRGIHTPNTAVDYSYQTKNASLNGPRSADKTKVYEQLTCYNGNSTVNTPSVSLSPGTYVVRADVAASGAGYYKYTLGYGASSQSLTYSSSGSDNYNWATITLNITVTSATSLPVVITASNQQETYGFWMLDNISVKRVG